MQVSEVGVISIQNRNLPNGLYNSDLKIKSKKNTEHSQVLEHRSLPPANVLRGYYLNNKQPVVSFRGAPWKLDYSDIGVPEKGSISAQDAICVFYRLKCGNYLDVGEDKTNYYSNKAIRDYNLNFLDRITDTREKAKFVQYYKDLTGFPNLSIVSTSIKNELINAIDKASRDLYWDYGSEYEVVQAGYDGVCSVARGKALPGSDIDKAYVILKGGSSDSDDREIVNKFKGKIWEYTDQRILSYNHDDAAFPQVYTERQFRELLRAADKVALELIPGGYPPFFPIITRGPKKYDKYTSPLGNYNTDYVEANKFFIDICKRFPSMGTDNICVDFPSRENIKNLGFVLEAMREGERFSKFGQMDYLNFSTTYSLVNLSQLKALKKQGDSKPKRLAREKLERDFPNWSIDKQFRLIKALIHGSCGNNTDFTSEFAEYFSKSGNDPFAPLIKALMD